MIVLLELLTVLLEYLDHLTELCYVQIFLLPKLYFTSNASTIPDSYIYLLCLKLYRHNRRMPTQDCSVWAKNIFFLQYFLSTQNALKQIFSKTQFLKEVYTTLIFTS